MLTHLKPAIAAGFLLFGAKALIDNLDWTDSGYAEAIKWMLRKAAIIGGVCLVLLNLRNRGNQGVFFRRMLIAFAALAAVLCTDAVLLVAYRAIAFPASALAMRVHIYVFLGSAGWGMFSNFYIPVLAAMYIRPRVSNAAKS